MAISIDNNLKKFILSELREKGLTNLQRIINHATVVYIEPASYVTAPDKCKILISNKEDYRFIKEDLIHYQDILTPIVADAKNILKNHFGYFLNIEFAFDLENRKDIDISNINEDVGELEGDKQKMIQKYRNEDFEGALTSAKSFLETVFKTYLDNKGIIYDKKNAKFPALGKKVRDKIEQDKPLQYKSVIGGIKSICQGINEARNEDGDGHGKPVQDRNEIDKSIVKVIIESTISVGHFIIQHY